MKRFLFIILLASTSFFAFSIDLSYGIEVDLKYNMAVGSQLWGEYKQNMYFHQFQIAQDYFCQARATDDLYISAKVSLLNDLYTSVYKYNEMREKFACFLKFEPVYYFSNIGKEKEYFAFANLMLGRNYFMDIKSNYLSIGCDFGGGMKILSDSESKYSAYVKCFFSYIRGSYTNEYSFGAGIVNMFR